ncbi:MAG: YybH family protein [Candidatus Acidiferrales bacterium]
MKNRFGARFAGMPLRNYLILLIAAVLLLTSASLAEAQQKEKKKKKDAPADNSGLAMPLTDEQQIDYMISEMLGAWQLGDIERLHKAYADEVVVVSGVWAPPVIGWNNYLASYQLQKARMQQVRMDRINTLVKVDGTVGWACYQWDFGATVDGQPSSVQGQTTLILEKRNDHWVIVHNHTSLVPSVNPSGTQPKAQPQPDKPS